MQPLEAFCTVGSLNKIEQVYTFPGHQFLFNQPLMSLFCLQMGKAKEIMGESVIKGTTRVPGKQLVIIISRVKEADGDQSEDAKTADNKRASTAEENGTEEGCSKFPRLSEGEEQQQNT